MCILSVYWSQVELTMHDGTVRDVCFIEDTSNMASLLVSGGAGDCKIYITDCATGNPFQVSVPTDMYNENWREYDTNDNYRSRHLIIILFYLYLAFEGSKIVI